MRITWSAFLVGILLGTAAAAVEIIPFSEVKPGMTGYGLTVVAGDEISRFEVEVVGVIDEPGTRNDFIVIRATGDAVERSGGIAQGMSGSPVYLDGKLAGALSRAALWGAEPTRPLGLVTPIEPMLEILEDLGHRVYTGVFRGALPVERVEYAESAPKAPAPDTLYVLPVSVPVMVGGISERSLEVLKRGLDFSSLGNFPVLRDLLPPWAKRIKGLAEYGLGRFVQAPWWRSRPQTPSEPVEFAPGSPLGVGLMDGDMIIGALGTVTLTEGENLVAFGHPFLFFGDSGYFLTEARIIDTVATLDSPFKLGVLGETVGGIFADRWAGIGGTVGLEPRSVSLRYEISDHTQLRDGYLRARMVDEPRLSPLLLYVSGLGAMDRTVDGIVPGTALVRFTIDGEELPWPFVRQNVYLSTHDIAAWVPLEAAIIYTILEYNEFTDPGIDQVKLYIILDHELKAVEILGLVTDKDAYAPGETISFTVYLRNWRGELEALEGEITIPEDIYGDYVELRAYGGPRPLESGEKMPVFEDLEDLLEYLEGIPTFNTLTVELFALDPISDVVGQSMIYGVDSVSRKMGMRVVIGEDSVYLPLVREGGGPGEGPEKGKEKPLFPGGEVSGDVGP